MSGNGLSAKCKMEDDEICEDDGCVSVSGHGEDGWIIIIELREGVSAIDFSSPAILITISEASGIEAEELSVGIEVDEDGHIKSVYVSVGDEGDADILEEAISICTADNSTVVGANEPGSNECGGILRYAKTVTMRTMTVSSGSRATYHDIIILIILVKSIVMCFVFEIKQPRQHLN